MLALRFSFPARRYHATPWGRHVNEADVAWPPEPWRILRALIASYWRKGACNRWSEADAAALIDALALAPPVYHLPEGSVHAHTRHYMPAPERKTLVFDAFAHLPDGAQIVAGWPDLALEPRLFELITDLAGGIGYLGRAESWVECQAVDSWDSATANCLAAVAAEGHDQGASESCATVILARTATDYAVERARLLQQADADAHRQAADGGKRPPTARALERARARAFGPTLPERLLDALQVDTSDYQKYGWSRPPAAREIVYARTPLSPLPGRTSAVRRAPVVHRRVTVARYLLAGRPQPRIEDAVRIGELMRLAALARFGWEQDPHSGRPRPQAPPAISGRGSDGQPLQDAQHTHAFWLPEDADGDGKIDHICVYAAAGLDARVRAALDDLTRLWLRQRDPADSEDAAERGLREWRLALEGFGSADEFASASALFGQSQTWISVTPFLPTAHLKRTGDDRLAHRLLERGSVVHGPLAEATGYPREVRRLVQRRGIVEASLADCIQVDLLPYVEVHGTRRRPLHFHRFRSRGRERTTNSHGALLRLHFPAAISGPMALGYGCHFGLGLFAVDQPAQP